jgi:pyridoxamine 5'-phosphate oxidase
MSEDARLADLVHIEAAVWAELERAVRSRGTATCAPHEWRRAVLATQDADGPQARSVVFRDVHADTRELIFYADARSPKVSQLRSDPRAVLMCWSEALGWQLRLRCRIEAETSGLDVTARWARIRHSPAAHDYLSPMAPGTPLTDAQGAQVVTPVPPERLRETFAVLTAKVDAVDWLELHALGHRRALFDARGARWLVP